jgi:hypothetical protein
MEYVHMKQKFEYKYQDAQIVVELHAENDEDTWANNRDLGSAIETVLRCASNWKTFKLHVTSNAYDGEELLYEQKE